MRYGVREPSAGRKGNERWLIIVKDSNQAGPSLRLSSPVRATKRTDPVIGRAGQAVTGAILSPRRRVRRPVASSPPAIVEAILRQITQEYPQLVEARGDRPNPSSTEGPCFCTTDFCHIVLPNQPDRPVSVDHKKARGLRLLQKLRQAGPGWVDYSTLAKRLDLSYESAFQWFKNSRSRELYDSGLIQVSHGLVRLREPLQFLPGLGDKY